MRRASEAAERLTASAVFYCRAKKKRLSVEECLERYVDSNAFEKKRSACWRCYQGRSTRSEYSIL